ncbi:MAG: glycosyltransferase family 2 protein [Clostridia bacterium]|nr:glycosyltransferase family 2 protein [Clostridia bacterium]
MEKISLIIPCYNEEESLPPLYAELKRVTAEMTEYTFEMLFIDDGSKDQTLPILKEMAKTDERVKYIAFSRNFGKEAAMYAGFCNVTGDYAAVMDADMQDPPALLPEMMNIIQSGDYDSVATRRKTRKGEPVIRSFFAKMFYKIMNKISPVDMVDGARDFRLMKRKMVDAIVAMSETNRFSKGIFGWIGFKTYWLAYDNIERVAGKTKWNFWKLLKYSIDGIMNFSDAPLKLASWSGFFFTFVAAIMLLVVFIRALVWGDPVAGWPSTVCIILFVGGIQLFCIGVIGQYVSKVYTETKKRPQYIVGDTNKEDVVRK